MNGDKLITRLEDILSSFLGESRSGVSANGECEFNCPQCAQNDGVESDGKYNLQCNLLMGVYHCWKCGSYGNDMRGHMFRLIRDYGDRDSLREYRRVLNEMRESGLYRLGYRTRYDGEVQDIELPKPLHRISESKAAMDYLGDRRIDKGIIDRFGLRCTTGDASEWMDKYRIVIPSYDEYGILNYWTGRDYLGGNPKNPKYRNAKCEKKGVIFNECNINWNADVTIVEGPFDMLSCVPNTVPSLGKCIDRTYRLYQVMYSKLNANVNIFYDGDAFDSVKKAYEILNSGRLKGRVRYVPVDDGMDPNDVLVRYGRKGLIDLVRSAKKFDEQELENINL